jgi:hypothetical protein
MVSSSGSREQEMIPIPTKIRAVREDPEHPMMDCYPSDLDTIAKLAVTATIANHPSNKEPPKMTDTLSTQVKPRPTRPLTSLPSRLTAEACLEIIARIDPEHTAAGIAASREKVDVDQIDSALEYTELSISDRFRFKQALAQLGIMSAGRRV